jgi:hypothetical protein
MTSSNTNDISEDDINDAQDAWCEGLLNISRAWLERETRGDEYKRLARQFLVDLYDDFEENRVFFRPTLAMAPYNFRTTREGALAYFIGEDPDNFPNDKGFIKLGWLHARYDNVIEDKKAIQRYGNIGIAMGNVYLRTDDMSIGGRETIVDKVFVFRKDDVGRVRLIVHNSAATNMPPTEVPEN